MSRTKKVISFSLYGNKPNYQIGAILNVIEAKRLFPDWVCRFYTTDPPDVLSQLAYLGAEIVDMRNDPLVGAKMFWRFLAADDKDVKSMMVRDADSVVSTREVVVIDRWLKSEDEWEFHIIRDHPAHRSVPIPGGMWGYTYLNNKANAVNLDEKPMRCYIRDDWMAKMKKGVGRVQDDQRFLKWFYERLVRLQASVLRYGPQGIRIPPHEATRYTKHVGARTLNHGHYFNNTDMVHGFDKNFFNSQGWNWWHHYG